MNCRNVQVQLSAFLDDELSGSEMLEVRRHLLDCEACREEEEALRTLKSFLGQAPTAEPSEEFEDRLLQTVWKVQKTEKVRQRTSLWMLSGIAAASMLTTLLVLPPLRAHQESVRNQEALTATHESDISRRQMADYASDSLFGGTVPPQRDATR